MKVWTLSENTAADDSFAAEHGLSLYIAFGDRKILFDAGQTGAFADNGEKLGIDLSAVDLAVLSHGHYDHGGGLTRFLECNSRASVYLRREAFLPHYNAAGKYIGLDPALESHPRLIFTEDTQNIAEGISLYSCNRLPRPFPTDSFGLTQLTDGQLRPDDFRHEQYLLLEENGKRVLFSGCSHKGILNLVQWFRPDVLIGGFHFKPLDITGRGRQVLTDAARLLTEQPTVYYTGHCTGSAQYAFLKRRMGRRLNALSTGTCFEI